MVPTSSSSLISSSGALPDSSRTRRIALSAMRSSSSRSRSHSSRSSWSSTNSALSRMRVIGVRRSWPAAATRRMRLSTALFSRAEREFSARAVALTSAGPRSGNTGMSMASEPTNSTASSSRTSGRTMRFATNTAIAVAPSVISASQRNSTFHGTPCGGKSEIGISSQPRPSTGIETTSGAPHPSRVMVTASVSPRAASEARKRSVEAA